MSLPSAHSGDAIGESGDVEAAASVNPDKADSGNVSSGNVSSGTVDSSNVDSGTVDSGTVTSGHRPAGNFRLATRDTLGVGLGLFPLGLAFGILVVQAGLDWWWAPAFSFAIYAGSMEFVALGLVMTLTPLAQIGLATLLVNFRHVFYGLTFPLHNVRGPIAKTYSIYALTDEVYALTAGRRDADLPQARLLWLQVWCQTYWIAGGVTGALLGGLIPARIVGLEFALTALFAVLAIDAFRSSNRDILSPALALGASVVALVVAKDQMMVAAMGLFVLALIVRYLLALARHRKKVPDA